MTEVRLAVVADLREERWPSMDLVSELLVEGLRGLDAAEGQLRVTELCPAMVRRATHIPVWGQAALCGTVDRVVNRHWDYPRWLSRRATEYELFHIIDHSYAHLARVLPAGRSVVTCHDLDAFAAALPGASQSSLTQRTMSRRLIDGLRAAARVVCGTRAVQQALVERGLVPRERIDVVPYAIDRVYSSVADPWADDEALRQCGPDDGQPMLLHVGSTISRKRIDVLLQVFAALRVKYPACRLFRVGGALEPAHVDQARQLGVDRAIVTLPFLDRRTLAAVYRRATLVLQPSEREGFGLPVVEALACGTPVVASDIPTLREAGGEAATYCRVADVDAWAVAVDTLLEERIGDPRAWHVRRREALRHASRFTPDAHARRMLQVYRHLCPELSQEPLALAECG